jgi:hypothetical protein
MFVPSRHIKAAIAAFSLFAIAPAAIACCNPPGQPGGPNVGGPVIGPPTIGVPTVGFGTGGVVGGGNGGSPGCCDIPKTHNIDIPGINVGTPNINVGAPNVTLNQGGVSFGGVNVVGGGVSGGGIFLGGGVQEQQFIGGGGGGGVSYDGPSGGMFSALSVVGAGDASASTQTETATRTVMTEYALRAVCLDDRGAPHPASQVSGDRNVTGREGEIYRCMAGTAMQITVGRLVNGAANYDGAHTINCAKGQALAFIGGQLGCATQSQQASCHERSLLRRYGPGEKVIAIATTETYQTTRVVNQTVTTRTQAVRSTRETLRLDGGVNGN